MDDNKARIITKRASKIRFTISNALGGIGKVEIAIIVIDFLITALIFSFLFKYQIIASVLITTTFMPRMKCNARVVMAFRNEAKIKKWQLTTLMNEILAERYSIDLENNNYEDD